MSPQVVVKNVSVYFSDCPKQITHMPEGKIILPECVKKLKIIFIYKEGG